MSTQAAPRNPGKDDPREPGPRMGRGILGRISGAWGDLLSRPLTDYFMILSIVVILSCLGVVMVYSSSMTWSLQEGGSVWGTALRQAVMIVVGFAAMWVALLMRPQKIRSLAPTLLVIAIILLLAVQIPGIGTGREEVGSQSWISLGPVQFQPSEIAKVAIIVWGAHFLAGRGPDRHWFLNPRMAFGGVGAAMTLLIFLEGDAGMAVSFALVVVFMLLFSGIALGWIAAAGGVLVIGLIAMAAGGGFRSNRFAVYFDALFGNFNDTRGTAFQSYQGFLSLADGSATGVGLGQSRAKWFYLPEAKNDFIFAIIGEELGFFGAAVVILLFAALLYFGLRTARRNRDPFLSLMAATLTASVVAQAFINIGYVVGLLPVTGIQLPLISAGGTSAVITLASMGLLISCARHEPEAVSAMASYGRPAIDRLLMLREPTSTLTTGNLRAPAKKPRPQPAPPAQRKQEEGRQRFGEPVTARHQPRGGDSREGTRPRSGGEVRSTPREARPEQPRRTPPTPAPGSGAAGSLRGRAHEAPRGGAPGGPAAGRTPRPQRRDPRDGGDPRDPGRGRR